MDKKQQKLIELLRTAETNAHTGSVSMAKNYLALAEAYAQREKLAFPIAIANRLLIDAHFIGISVAEEYAAIYAREGNRCLSRSWCVVASCYADKLSDLLMTQDTDLLMMQK